MKLKYTLVFTIISFFIATAGFAQTYSDKEIGFDVERATLSLKEHGLQDEYLSKEISIMREVQLLKHLELKKFQDSISKKVKSQERVSNITNRAVAVMDIPQAEKDALFALYNSLDGPHWIKHTGWDFTTPVTSWDENTGTGWYGVTVTDDHVTRLDLNYNYLSKDFSAAFPNLDALQKLKILYLTGNDIKGTIPNLSALIDLEILALGGNKFEGTIPNSLYSLVKLKELTLYSNRLEGDFSGIGQYLTNLTTLTLGLNRFDFVNGVQENNLEIPSSFQNLTSLRNLNISNCGLSQNLELIGNLINITDLDIAANNFSGALPNNFTNLTKLKSLSVSYNKFDDISALSNVNNSFQYLYATRNLITAIPPVVGTMTRLQTLMLENNKIKTIPLFMQNCIELRHFTINSNLLEGKIPDLTALTKLSAFSIEMNKLRSVDFIAEYPSYKNTIYDYFYYDDQEMVDENESITKLTGESVTFTMFTDNRYSPTDTYQWSKDGVVIPGATNRQYTISNLTIQDRGSYTCVSKNSLITTQKAGQLFILYRRSIDLRVTPPTCYSVPGEIKTPTEIIAPHENTTFSLETTATNITYQWTLYGENNVIVATPTTSTATQSYNSPGYYLTNLIVTEPNGCKTYFNKTIKVCASVTGQIEIPTESIVTNQVVPFTFNTTNTNINYSWTFYNLDNSVRSYETGSSVSKSFTSPGNYRINLVLTDRTLACKTSIDKIITVTGQCDIPGTIESNPGDEAITLYQSVYFRFDTESTSLNYKWTITTPDSSTTEISTDQNAFYYFQSEPGTYKVTLEVSDSNGCSVVHEKIYKLVYNCDWSTYSGEILNMNYLYNENILLNGPNTFQFYPYSGTDLSQMSLLWELLNSDDQIIDSATTEEFTFKPTTLGYYTLRFQTTDKNGCINQFSTALKSVDSCIYSDEKLDGFIALDDEDPIEVPTIEINQTKELSFHPYQETTTIYTYKWEIFNANDQLIDFGNQETKSLTLPSAGFYKVSVDIENGAGCILHFSKPVRCLIQNSCTTENPKSEIVKKVYKNLLKNLIVRSLSGETDSQINASRATTEFTALKPYITNGIKDKIYNYTTTRDSQGKLTNIRFSFSPDRDYDAQVSVTKGIWNYEQYSDETIRQFSLRIESEIYIDLSQFTSSDNYLISCYNQKAQITTQAKFALESKDCYHESEVRYIDFCPSEACLPTFGIIRTGQSITYPTIQSGKKSKKSDSKL